jgi:hypothetical protein
MQNRYALRFENGERRGETIPITGSGISVGRKPGNAIQVLDASVSGRHAELVVDAGGVLLRDLGSTNGTRVGAERISEQRLAHADQVLFGNVRMVFLDTEVGDAPGPASPPAEVAGLAGTAQDAGEAVRTVSAERVAKSGKRSLVGGIVLVLAVGAAVGGWFWFNSGGGQRGPTHTVKAVQAVEGNLLADGYSFEGDAGSWTSDEAGPVAFNSEPSARRSGANGLEASLNAGEWALSRSPAVSVSRGHLLAASAWLHVSGAADATLGLQFESSAGAAAPTIAWSKPLASGGEFEQLEVRAPVPTIYDQARVVVRARASGQASPPDASGSGGRQNTVDIDDASLVASAAADAPPTLDEFQLFALGAPPTAAVLHKIDRELISDLTVLQGGVGLDARALELSVEPRENGFALGCGKGAGRTLALRVETALVVGGEGTQATGRVATIGNGGYRTHSIEFTREAVTSLILGSGKDQVALVFTAPANLHGLPEAEPGKPGGFQIEAALGDGEQVLMQLVFRSERDAAQDLARSAREAEKEGKLGAALAAWADLRDKYPFESNLLAEADAARGRLTALGLTEMRDLRQRADRARFLRLVDIFRRCKSAAELTAAKFQGSEVETEARALIDSIQGDLSQLEADLDRAEVARLKGMVSALETQKSPKLAQLVRDYLSERYGQSAGGDR